MIACIDTTLMIACMNIARMIACIDATRMIACINTTLMIACIIVVQIIACIDATLMDTKISASRDSCLDYSCIDVGLHQCIVTPPMVAYWFCSSGTNFTL